MRVLNEVLPKGPTTDCVLPGKTFIWLPFAGGISAFAVILPKPLGSVDRVVDGYPDAFHVNRWLRSLEAISPDPQMRASLRSIPPNTSDSRMTLDYSSETPTRLRPATKEPERFLSYSYLVFEPGYLAELPLTNGLGRPLDFIPRFASPDPLLHQITAALSVHPRSSRERWVPRPCRQLPA
jgi:hypothetical protein